MTNKLIKVVNESAKSEDMVIAKNGLLADNHLEIKSNFEKETSKSVNINMHTDST